MTRTTAPFPPASTQAIDTATGQFTASWYLTQFNIYTAAGGNSGITLVSVNEVANQALNLAGSATNIATLAQAAAANATAIANASEATANASEATANTAAADVTMLSATALLKANNLNDVTDVPSSRKNLGVDGTALLLNYDGHPASGQVRYIPITIPIIIPADFAGTETWVGSFAALDAVFNVSYISAAISHPIGTITLVNGGQFHVFVSSGDISLKAGDKLVITAPSPQDSTLANVAITILCNLT